MKKILPVFVVLFFAVTTVFAQRIPFNKPILFKATSTECNVCGLRAWDEMKQAIELYEEDAVIIAVHPLEESLLHSSTSTELMENTPQFFGTPTFFVNNQSLPFQWFGEARKMIEAFQEKQVVAHPFIEYIIEDNQVKVEVKTQYLRRTNRPHYISAYVIEDKVKEFQSNRGPEDLHSKIMRTHLGEAVFGELLSTENIEIDQEFTNNYTLEIDPKWVAENLEVAVVIWERIGERYEIINANVETEPTGLSTSINILAANEVNLQIQPTIINNSATVQLDLPLGIEGINLQVINALGQRVKNIFRGDLPKGNHAFTLNRSDYAAGGIYFLVAEKNGDRLVKKMIIK